MALRWSSEFTVTEFQDLQADTMALDTDGNMIVLAGRRHFSIKRLNDTGDTVDTFPRNQKYDGSVAEWNPSPGERHHFALTTNEQISYVAVREGGVDTLSPFKHHTRQVTDLNWHSLELNQLATASADSTTLVWDTRDSRRPAVIFTAVAGVNQVRWNKLSSFLVATAHDGDLRIWDQRKGSLPVQYIAAHSNKIHGIDWSQTHEYQLASCSQDCTVKLFDMTNPRRAESVMHTTGPVWRVRYTPWGEGLMTAVIPPAGEESSVQLWNLSSHSGPVHTFVGPLDVVLEAQWRREGGEYQLVTWSRDRCLRVCRIEPFLQRQCGYLDADARADTDSDAGPTNSDIADAELGTIAALDSGSPGAGLPTFNPSFGDWAGAQMMERGTMHSLDEEFEFLANTLNLPNITCQSADMANRTCVVMASVNSHEVTLLISFPPSYPYNAAPSFQIEESSLVDSVLKTKLLKVLKQTAQQRVRKNRNCLDCCLSQLVSTLEGTATTQLTEERAPAARTALGSSPARVADAASVYSSFHDAYIPYPRFSGARFCSVGMLVCFSRAARVSARQEPSTPRSLSAATSLNFGGSFVGSYPRYPVTGSSQDASDNDLGFFLPDRSLGRALSRGNRTAKLPRTVAVYDASKLFFVHKELAEKYSLDVKDVAGACAHNATAAASVGRQDLVQVWTLASFAASAGEEDGLQWSKHPFSTAQMDHLIQHYAKVSDIQTAAMLSCVFPHVAPNKTEPSKTWPPVGSSPYHTIHPSDTSLQGWVMPVLKHNRSNSWSESAEEQPASIVEHREVTTDIQVKRPRRFGMRDELKRRYADILHMWGLLEVRTSVLKLLDSKPAQHSGLEFLLECQNCKKPVVGSAFCTACLRYALRCAICRVLVRGASNICLVCGHGGHASHMFAWFSTETVCPSGCGCNCATETRHALDT